ncbi:MAG: GNAT family N-acetyltransferase [Candidatus Theseobacter exili]|nr:GNAT family N-acetyltransferase [Candidatus Theseobacter exili]
MTETRKEQKVIMINEDLNSAPVYPLSPDLILHWYEPEDEKYWIAIHKEADKFNVITPQLFDKQFGNDKLNLRERQCYLLDKTGKAIATATAWEKKQGEFAGFGQVHWVAVVPEWHNQGLGKMIVSIICQRLIELGYTQAFLDTSDLRPAAIHLYEKFGFKIQNDSGEKS